MSKTDWAVVGLNLVALVWAIIGLTAQHLDPMSIALVVTVATAIVNGGWVLRRSRDRDGAASLPSREAEDALDAHAILDIDARLERLERAEALAHDTETLRALAATGEVRPPSAPTADAPQAARPLRDSA